ncbi:hypothetical protein DdX_10500 [Ditylenchus destructor]|uniref:Uncharacterized protein n=1 Tax=Ditylenchus destructor TaxID=166010 RepID=A0AAD4R572_9BILA|nr:hypothetical protein DdX_10500 [Ditylenchus destructor]
MKVLGFIIFWLVIVSKINGSKHASKAIRDAVMLHWLSHHDKGDKGRNDEFYAVMTNLTNAASKNPETMSEFETEMIEPLYYYFPISARLLDDEFTLERSNFRSQLFDRVHLYFGNDTETICVQAPDKDYKIQNLPRHNIRILILSIFNKGKLTFERC